MHQALLRKGIYVFITVITTTGDVLRLGLLSAVASSEEAIPVSGGINRPIVAEISAFIGRDAGKVNG
jgi:hypothetical protein